MIDSFLSSEVSLLVMAGAWVFLIVYAWLKK